MRATGNRGGKMANLDLSNLSALIVDDNFHMRQLVKTVLSALNLRQVAEAEDGASAIKTLQSFEADFVICDWAMNPIDGIDFTKLIRTSEDSPNIYLPIIMLSGHTEMNRIMIARDAGVNEFLAKPVSATNLYQRIKAIIEQPRKYVRTPSYFGPDRRRREDPNYIGNERRKEVAESA